MKSKFLLPLLIALAAVLPASAQWRPVWGARLAMEITAPSGGHDIYKTGAGFTAGVTCRMPLYRDFYFEPGALFSFSAMTSKDLVTFDDEYFYEGAANLYGIRVPLNFGYSFSAGNLLDIGVFTGPWINFNIAARQKLDPNFAATPPIPDRKINLFEHGWKRVDAQWGFGLSFTFADCYYIGITGGVAFTPLASYGNKDKKIRIHRNTIAISLGYNF